MIEFTKPIFFGIIIFAVIISSGIVIAVFFPNLLLPNRLEVDDNTSTQDLFERYNILIRSYITGKDFEELGFPVRDKIIDEINQINLELENDLNKTSLDPDKGLGLSSDALSKPCTDNCQTSPELVNPCAGAGLFYDETLGCISEPVKEIIDEIKLTFNPEDPATEFDVLTIITLKDSSGVEFVEEGRFNVPLTSLITPEGRILDLASVRVKLVGASDSNNPIKTQGTLNYKINGQSVRGIPVVTTALPNEITSAFDIKINNRLEDSFSFQGVTGLKSGLFANKFEVTLRDFKVTQGNSTFTKFGEIVLYDLDFTFDQGLKTVIGSTGIAQAIPIDDGKIELCATVRGYKPAEVLYIFIPDKPKSVMVRQDTGETEGMIDPLTGMSKQVKIYNTVIPSFTVNLNGATSNGLKTYCETRSNIPRSSNIEIVITGIDFGTGGGNQIQKAEKVFQIITPESKKDFKIECLSGNVDFPVHWCNSDFGYGHSRTSSVLVVSP